jgi:hypothetical protein
MRPDTQKMPQAFSPAAMQLESMCDNRQATANSSIGKVSEKVNRKIS